MISIIQIKIIYFKISYKQTYITKQPKCQKIPLEIDYNYSIIIVLTDSITLYSYTTRVILYIQIITIVVIVVTTK